MKMKDNLASRAHTSFNLKKKNRGGKGNERCSFVKKIIKKRSYDPKPLCA